MAEENTSTTTSGEPGAGGGSPEGFVPLAVFEAAEAKRRDMQSQLDKLRAAQAAPAAPAAPESTSSTGTVETELAAIKAKLGSLDPNAFADAAMARFTQAQALDKARVELREEFKNARSEVFSASYQTPEEMRAAVEASHAAETEAIAAVEARVREEMRTQIKELHGVDLAPAPQAPATGDKPGDTGPSTIRDLAAMPFDQLAALPDDELAKALART